MFGVNGKDFHKFICLFIYSFNFPLKKKSKESVIQIRDLFRKYSTSKID